MELKVRNTKSAEDGVWITQVMGDLDLLIASTDKVKYKEMADEKFEKDIQNKALAKHILLGWRNLQINKEDIPYSEEKAYEILCNPEYIEFRKLVISLAEEEEVFRKEALENLDNKS